MKMIEKNQHAIILLPDSKAKSKYPQKDLTRGLPNGHLFCEYGPWSHECRRDIKLNQQKTGFPLQLRVVLQGIGWLTDRTPANCQK